MGQLNYSYNTPVGVPGGLLDISPYRIDSRAVGSNGIKYGMGAVQGSKPGVNIALPTSTSTADQFEGVVMTGYTKELTMDGEIVLKNKDTVGVLPFGCAWVRTTGELDPAYGDQLVVVTGGSDAGLFTNNPALGINVNGRFLKDRGTGDVAAVEIYGRTMKEEE